MSQKVKISYLHLVECDKKQASQIVLGGYTKYLRCFSLSINYTSFSVIIIRCCAALPPKSDFCLAFCK